MAHRATVKGQVTIPKRVRDHLGIKPGSGVEFEVGTKGEVVLRKAGRSSKHSRPRSRFAGFLGSSCFLCAEHNRLTSFGIR